MDERVIKERWRLEALNPFEPLSGLGEKTGWRPLWGFDEDEHAAYRELVADLNRINAPVQLRIVRNSDSISDTIRDP